LGGGVLARVFGLPQLVLGAADFGLVGVELPLLLTVIALGLSELRPLRLQHGLDPSEIRLGRRQLRRNRLLGVLELLDLGVVLLQILETLKLIAQLRFLSSSSRSFA